MGDLATILPSQFGLSKRAIREKGYFVCKNFKIYKTSDTHEEIKARFILLEEIAEAGFPWTDRIILSTQGVPYVQLGRETYIMTKHIVGCEVDLFCNNNVILAVESLARFHNAARGVTKNISIASSQIESFNKQTAMAVQALKQINRRMSDFDVMFIKHAPYYKDLAIKASETLENTGYLNLLEHSQVNNHICHNNLKEESLPILEKTCHIIRFSEASIDLQLTDLSGFIRRYALRGSRELSVNHILEIYNRISPLPMGAKEIINAQLLYPWTFMKIIAEYYSKKRNWTPVAITSRMTTILEEEPMYATYITYS